MNKFTHVLDAKTHCQCKMHAFYSLLKSILVNSSDNESTDKRNIEIQKEYSFTIQFIHNWNSIVHKWLREWSLPYPMEILNNIEWKRNVFLLMSSKIKPHTPDYSDQITMFRKELFEFWYLYSICYSQWLRCAFVKLTEEIWIKRQK